MTELETLRIVAVAIRYKDVTISQAAPARHSDLISELAYVDDKFTKDAALHGEQGFLTSAGEFANRWVAATIACKAGQMKMPRVKSELFSEDVW